MADMVNNPKHYNDHPSGIECIEVIEHMTFNLGNACKYLWRGGLKASDPTEDYRKALWYAQRSLEHDTAFLFGGAASMHFLEVMSTRTKIFARPSPWCEPVRHAIASICDLHSNRPVTQRIDLYDKLFKCIRQAIDDQNCMGRGLEP